MEEIEGGGGGGGGERKKRSRREAETSNTEEEEHQPRVVKRDPESSNRDEAERGESSGGGGGGGRQDVVDRRRLRNKYLAVKNLINDERENISGQDRDKFNSIFKQVENLHHLVQKPREQIADAEALLDIASTIVASVKSHGNDGVTPSDFITALLREFPPENGEISIENLRASVPWAKIGSSTSHILRKVHGCSTMLGPMTMEQKQRKAVQRRQRTKPTEDRSRPEELDDKDAEERTDTDKNMATMFNILRKKRSTMLEHLILNRSSFAQTVENLFALSFLVKDGRVEITMDDNGHHLVLPRNAPAATAVASGNVSYKHFVFRFDFNDWKLMMDYVPNGEELMPHRSQANLPSDSQGELVSGDSQAAAPTTPIRKLCRNRGLVIQEESVVEDSPENNVESDKACAIRRGKRKIQ